MDRISFYVPQGVRDPNAVFATLTYLLGESAAVDTLMLYGAYPADPSLYAAFNAQLAAHFPHVQHWEVVAESIALSSLPYHEAWFPGYELVQERIENFSWLLDGGYPQFDMDKALDRLELDLQAIVIAAR